MKKLQLKEIVKTYGSALALRHADLTAHSGEVVAICGENGAGKSTLMSILAGSRRQTLGTIEIDGEVVDIFSPHHAFDLGIRTVYQELSLLPQLSVAENLFLGDLPVTRWGMVDWKQTWHLARKEMANLGMAHIDVRWPVGDYPVAAQQMVEIAKALRVEPRVLILDEPTGVLTNVEAELLFAKIEDLKARGTIILYISHRLEEVLQISDKLVVLKDGATVDVMTRTEASEERLITSMVGRPLEDIYPPKRRSDSDDLALHVEGLAANGRFRNIDIKLRKGEILGFAGLVGSGRTEIMRAIFGADHYDAGTITIDGQELKNPTPKRAIKLGIGFVTEERKKDGLALDADILENVSLAAMDRVSLGQHLQRDQQRKMVRGKAEELDVRPLKLDQLLRHMSGGNQQKVVLAKWLLLSGLKILILDEPTRGVDIATKVQIYRLIAQLADEGLGILLISSEMPELLGLSHRICVLRHGEIAAELDADTTSEHEIFIAAAGIGLGSEIDNDTTTRKMRSEPVGSAQLPVFQAV